MRDLHLFLGLHVKMLRNKFSGSHSGSRLKLLVVTLFIVGFWLLLYNLFLWWFDFFKDTPVLVDRVVMFMFSLFFLALLAMLSFSNSILIYSAMFKEQETHFLFNCPIKRENIFIYKFVESITLSSWAFLLLGSPVILAYGRFFNADWTYFVFGFAFFIPFIFIPAALGTLLTFLIARYFARSKKAVLWLLISVIVIMLTYIGYKLYSVEHLYYKNTTDWMQEVMGQLRLFQSQYLPNYWMTHGIISVAEHQFGMAAFYFMLILSNGLFLMMLTYMFASSHYFQSFSLVHSISQKKKYSVRWGDTHFIFRFLRKIIFWLDTPGRLIIIKDIKGFIRDPVQWLQFMIFFGLLFIYILNLRNFSYHLRNPIWRNMISFLNLGAVCFTFSTFTSRFIYPALSLEGKKAWILGVAPLKRSSIILGKFFFSFLLGLIISETLIILSDYMLQMPWETVRFHMITCVLICTGLSGLSVGLGTLYIDLKEDNAAKIVSSFGGTLNLVISIAFVTMVIGSEVIIYRSLWTYHYEVALCVAGCITILFCFIPLISGIKSFEKLQF